MERLQVPLTDSRKKIKDGKINTISLKNSSSFLIFIMISWCYAFSSSSNGFSSSWCYVFSSYSDGDFLLIWGSHFNLCFSNAALVTNTLPTISIKEFRNTKILFLVSRWWIAKGEKSYWIEKPGRIGVLLLAMFSVPMTCLETEVCNKLTRDNDNVVFASFYSAIFHQ